VLPELFWLLDVLDEPGLQFEFPLLAIDEYKLKDGTAGKKRATRYERIPTGWLGCLCPEEAGVLSDFVPAGLPPEFTAAEFAKAARLRGRRASAALKVLQAVDAVRLTGTLRGRARLYRCTAGSAPEKEKL
jgi:hypothetical protein